MRQFSCSVILILLVLSACQTRSSDEGLRETTFHEIEPHQKWRIANTVNDAAAAINTAMRLKGRDGSVIATRELFGKTACVVAIQIDRSSFLPGGSGGEGLMSCRMGSEWSAPSFLHTGRFELGPSAGWERMQIVVFVADQNLAKRWKQSGTFTVNEYTKAVATDASAALQSLDQNGLAVVQASNGSLYPEVGISINSLSHAQDTRNQAVYGDLLGGGSPEDTFGRQCSAYVLADRRTTCVLDWERRSGKNTKSVASAKILQTPADNAPMITKSFNDQLRQKN